MTPDHEYLADKRRMTADFEENQRLQELLLDAWQVFNWVVSAMAIDEWHELRKRKAAKEANR